MKDRDAGSKFLRFPYLCLAATLFSIVVILPHAGAQPSDVPTDIGELKVESLADGLEHPWGMAFLPGEQLLITERPGRLRILESDGSLSEPLKGVPEVFASGQGGLLDVALDPEFEKTRLVYLSYAEPGENETASTALGRGKLQENELLDFKVIFRQEPKVPDDKHFGGRIVFSPEGHLFLTMGERFKFDPAQELSNHLGTIVRVKPNGEVPEDNPFADDQDARKEIWSYGHRNIEAAAFHPNTARLLVAEMGPQGGDELNLVEPGANYGWPVVSWGENYDGTPIADPPSRPEFKDALHQWTPVISPSGMIIYRGAMFPEWQTNVFIGGLSSRGLVRLSLQGNEVREEGRIPLNARIRDVEEAPDGSIYVLTDAEDGKVLRLSKAFVETAEGNGK